MNWREVRLALWPLGAMYEAGARFRVSLYRHGVLAQRRLDGTVISVGNLTVGGTGKTPMVLWLAERLVAEGHRPAILTRGYRSESPRNGGSPMADEVALLRMRLGARAQLGVGKNRYASGQVLQRHGAKWFILDDGFQHLALQRDVDIVLLDASDPFGGGHLLPRGRLREPPDALKRANIVVITRSQHAPAVESLVRRHTSVPIFYAQTELQAVLRAPALVVQWPLEERSSARFFAFCGIGNPRAFFEDLQSWGFSVAGERSFRDHHRYSPADLAALESASVASGADAIICTEKDVFNLRDAGAGTLPVYACRIGLAISDAAGFWNEVLARVGRRRMVKPA